MVSAKPKKKTKRPPRVFLGWWCMKSITTAVAQRIDSMVIFIFLVFGAPAGVGIEAIKNGLAPPRRNVFCDDVDARADRIPLLDQILHISFELRHQPGITTEKRILLHQIPIMGTRSERP